MNKNLTDDIAGGEYPPKTFTSGCPLHPWLKANIKTGSFARGAGTFMSDSDFQRVLHELKLLF